MIGKVIKKFIKTILQIAAAAVAVATAIGVGVCHFAFARNGGGKIMRQLAMNKAFGGDTDENLPVKNETEYTAALRKRLESFTAEVPEQRAEIIAKDGTRLAGFYYENENSHKWMIGFHGYRAKHKEILNCGFTTHFYDMGYNILTPDLRSCGESEGNYIGMGILEKIDVYSCINWVRWRDPEAEIILFGESMGAATVLLAAGEELPSNVKLVIADAGYANVWNMLFDAAKGMHLPAFLITPGLFLANFAAKNLAGFDMEKGDIAAQLSKSTLPILLFHGDADSMVPFENLQKLYDAIPHEKKEMHVAEGAGHVCSSMILQDEYWNIVKNFIEKYSK